MSLGRLGIFGSSGFARETADVALELGYEPVFISDRPEELDGVPGRFERLAEAELERAPGLPVAIGIGSNEARARIWHRYAVQLNFVNLIHPSATFGAGQRARIEAKHGVIVCAGVRFTNNIEIGNCTIFNLNATVGHDVEIGDFCNVAPGANISGCVAIGAGCAIGTGAQIRQGRRDQPLRIGEGAVVGAGAVVIADCDAHGVYAGVPARKIR